MYTPARLGIIFAVVAAILAVYVFSLYKIQIYETLVIGAGDVPQKTIPRTVVLPAARGNIYDRNGVLLASGRPSYDIRLERSALRETGDNNYNRTILELVYATMDEGYLHIDTFPITRGAPFEFVTDMTREQRRRLDAYFAFFSLDPNISVSEFLDWMRVHYKIDYTIGILDARLITGVRYELEMRVIIGNLTPYIFARDVSSDFVSLVEERGYIGVHAERGFIREYHTSYGAHILGYIRRMSPAQYEVYRERGYPMDAMVGQVGAELAFEEQLRGSEGLQVVRYGVDGTVMDVATRREPVPGNHVYLTMDLGLQVAVEHALQAQISIINRAREEEAGRNLQAADEIERITGGAVVVTDVRTGELLASASYPTYNPIELSRDYAMLSLDRTNPLFNRATHGRYTPGSTFKMVTALAGLRYDVINRYSEINDVGRYTRYEDRNFVASCWIYNSAGVGHGPLNVVQALERSCNYFFMSVADRLPNSSADGGRILAQTAREFGLGVSSGLELPEDKGILASPEWKIDAYAQGLVESPIWFSAEQVTTGFGQGNNRFTPVQLANYAATIANGGTLYASSILRKVVSSDFSETIHSHSPVVLNQIAETEYIEMIQEGMIAVARGGMGTARAVFRDYPVRVGAKTGTAQFDERLVDDGVFVCFAPAQNPEIAIAIVVEKGGSGSAVMDIARMIFDYYFKSESSMQAVPFGELIP